MKFFFYILFCIGLLPAFAVSSPIQITSENGVNIISCFDATKLPKWPGADDDHIYLTFMGIGRFAKAPEMTRNGESFQGRFTVEQKEGKSVFALTTRVVRAAPGELSYRANYHVEESEGKPVRPFVDLTFNRNMFGRRIEFTFEADGREFVQYAVIPPEKKEHTFLYSIGAGKKCIRIRFAMIQGMVTLSGFQADVWGLKYGPDMGNLRIFAPESTSGELEVQLRFKPFDVEMLDLTSSANMGFADETADDGKGGWTDQGSENDLHMLTPGVRRFGNIDFQIADPVKNNGKSCMVFANRARPGMLEKAEIEAGGKIFDYLYLLHSCAWAKAAKNAGTLTVLYADGTQEDFPISIGKDVGDWWNPKNLSNAWPVFLANRKSVEVGFQMSRFPVAPKPVKSVLFRKSTDDILWIVVAVNGVRGIDIPFSLKNQAEIPWPIRAGKDWRPMRILPTQPGSALDFSFLTDAPAGKYGRVVIRNGQFEFEKRSGVQARFFGANFCEHANHMTDEEIAHFIPQLQRAGYNAVRFHHYDNDLVKPGDRLEFEPAALDRFFKTFAACKEAGLYVTLDLFTSRRNGFPGTDRNGLKALFMLDPEFRTNLKEFSRVLLTTPNPYTGLPLAEDPALITVSHINENSQFYSWSEISMAPADSRLHQAFLRQFEKWCVANGIEVKPEDTVLRTRFFDAMHRESYRDLRDFLCQLGVTVPQTDMNSGYSLVESPPREEFDYTDVHAYMDHPTFPNGPWKMPFEYHNRSLGANSFLPVLHVFASRLRGKPLMISEYHYVAPNCFRLEGGPVIGALGGLHAVDGIFDFSPVSYDRKWVKINEQEPPYMSAFNSFNDPVTTLGNRIVGLLYLRGDVKASGVEHTLVLPRDLTGNADALRWRRGDEQERELLPASFRRLALIARTSVTIGGENGFTLTEAQQEEPNYLLRKLKFDPTEELIASTGEIRSHAATDRFIVVTPKTESITLREENATGECLSVAKNRVFTTIAASSLDGLPLRNSRRILFFHITDVKNGDNDYRLYRKKLRVYGWGGYPLLLRKGTAIVSLRSEAAGKIMLYALDITGKRLCQIPFTEKDGTLSFTADNTIGETPAIGYELVRK